MGQQPTQQQLSQQTGAGGQQGEPLYQTRNFLRQDVRATNVSVLNQCLADLVVVHSQLLSGHWNVKGRNFYQLHELFEELAEEFEGYIDEVAERATGLGGQARGSVYQAAQSSSISPLPPTLADEGTLLQHIADHLCVLDAELYRQMKTVEESGDLDTVDLLNEVSRFVSKALWFVEAHLQGPSAVPTSQGVQGQQMQGQQTQGQF
ncbi:DNA starvation/stationary phase protection protein Dps [Haloarculaceae archaeon H-GB2-1]|nr:DNA starvation/stationary phase protection protein Dps [Haloarculaceae archaeon H-GB11]MEA5410067.1 DNA starvation/stationary phase protection protein Dps [Haloarculaceae archaeon H-GB2-1]